MISLLLSQQQRELERYFAEFDQARAEELFEEISHCSGTILFSGVGKSGYIAQKIVSTLMSIGVAARFLDPLHAMHGDLGCVQEQDCLVCLSKSGSSRELLALVPYLKKRGVTCFAITNREGTLLAQQCDREFVIPIERELCPFDLAPTTSAVGQLLFGDCLAVSLMHKRALSQESYSANHPGGDIGLRSHLKVKDLMLVGEDLPVGFGEELLIDKLHTLSAKRAGCLLVIDEARRLLGIFTDGDLRRALQQYGSQALSFPLASLMTEQPRTIDQEGLAWDALSAMQRNVSQPISVLPVVEGSKLVGLLRLHDIL